MFDCVSEGYIGDHDVLNMHHDGVEVLNVAHCNCGEGDLADDVGVDG
jgi:hypothetical protein